MEILRMVRSRYEGFKGQGVHTGDFYDFYQFRLKLFVIYQNGHKYFLN